MCVNRMERGEDGSGKDTARMLSGFPYYFSYASHYQGERQATHGQKRNSEDRKATGGVYEPVFWISNIPLLLYLIKIKTL